jgi:hypothetical protein
MAVLDLSLGVWIDDLSTAVHGGEDDRTHGRGGNGCSRQIARTSRFRPNAR